MGCDIHVMVEHRKIGSEHWTSLGFHTINPGRNYEIFGEIAGLRGGEAIYPLRGVPQDASFATNSANRLYVSDDSPDAEDCTSRENAERWVANGSSAWTSPAQDCVTHPDWHSHTWLPAAEWRETVERERPWPTDDEYFALAAAMSELERRGREVRVVIWFDN